MEKNSCIPPFYDYKMEYDYSNLPKFLIEEIKKMEDADKNGDFIKFDYHCDILEVYAKDYYRRGKITKSDYKMLMRKYGGYDE